MLLIGLIEQKAKKSKANNDRNTEQVLGHERILYLQNIVGRYVFPVWII